MWQLKRPLLSIVMMLTTNQSGELIHSSPSQQQHCLCTAARQERGENQTDQYRGEGCLLMSQTLISMITCLPQEATKNIHFITNNKDTQWLVVSLQWTTCNHSKLSVNRISITGQLTTYNSPSVKETKKIYPVKGSMKEQYNSNLIENHFKFLEQTFKL